MAAMIAVASVGGMDIPARSVLCGISEMGRDEFTAAVVAAIDNALPDGFNRDLRFAVVNGGAAGHIVHVGVMNNWQR